MTVSLASLTAAVRAVSTEAAEKRAVESGLLGLGYRRLAEVVTTRLDDGLVCRAYLWRDTPLGTLALVTGPSLEGEVHVLVPHHAGDARGSVYLPAFGSRPALTSTKGVVRRNPTVSASGDITRSAYPGIFADAGHGIPAADDARPWQEGPSDTVEEVRLSDEIAKLIDTREDYVESMNEVVGVLRQVSGEGAKVKGRVKTPFSILNKLRRKRLKTLTDLAGTMAIVANRAEVDAVVKALRARFPVLDFVDYYRAPLDGYRAVHLVVRSSDGNPVEVQVKSQRMADVSHAAHTPYKEGKLNGAEMLRVTGLAAAADEGDTAAAREIDDLLADHATLEARLTQGARVMVSNPPKGPQKGEYPETQKGIAALNEMIGPTEDTYAAKLTDALLANKPPKGYSSGTAAKDFPKALGAAIFRAALKLVGIGDVFSVKVGDSYLSDFDVSKATSLGADDKAKYAEIVVGGFGNHSDSFDWGHTGGAKIDNDPGADYPYQGAGGWNIPGPMVHTIGAMIASAGKANGYTLTPLGQAYFSDAKKAAAAGGYSADLGYTPKSAKVEAGSPVVLKWSKADGLTVTGNTWPARFALSAAGFKWSGVQKVWFYPGSKAWEPQYADGFASGVSSTLAEAGFAALNEVRAGGGVSSGTVAAMAEAMASGADPHTDMAAGLPNVKQVVHALVLTLQKAGWEAEVTAMPGRIRVYPYSGKEKVTYPFTVTLEKPKFKLRDDSGNLLGEFTSTHADPFPVAAVFAYEIGEQLSAYTQTPTGGAKADTLTTEEVIDAIHKELQGAGYKVASTDIALAVTAYSTQGDPGTFTFVVEIEWGVFAVRAHPSEKLIYKGYPGEGSPDIAKAAEAVADHVTFEGYGYTSPPTKAAPMAPLTIEAVFAEAPGAFSFTPEWAYPNDSASVAARLTVQSGTQAGSNPGGIAVDPITGKKYYVKFPKTAKHVANEIAANQLYRLLGILAPDTRSGMVGGKLAVMSPWASGNPVKVSLGGWSEDERSFLGSQFPADAWLANYDVVGTASPPDNLLRVPSFVVESPKHYLRVDNGGALLYRAQGAEKETTGPKSWGPEVHELQTMLKSLVNPQAASVFSTFKDVPAIGKPMASRISTLAGATLSGGHPFLRGLLQSCGFSPADAVSLAGTLQERAADLVDKLGVSPSTSSAPASALTYDQLVVGQTYPGGVLLDAIGSNDWIVVRAPDDTFFLGGWESSDKWGKISPMSVGDGTTNLAAHKAYTVVAKGEKLSYMTGQELWAHVHDAPAPAAPATSAPAPAAPATSAPDYWPTKIADIKAAPPGTIFLFAVPGANSSTLPGLGVVGPSGKVFDFKWIPQSPSEGSIADVPSSWEYYRLGASRVFLSKFTEKEAYTVLLPVWAHVISSLRQKGLISDNAGELNGGGITFTSGSGLGMRSVGTIIGEYDAKGWYSRSLIFTSSGWAVLLPDGKTGGAVAIVLSGAYAVSTNAHGTGSGLPQTYTRFLWMARYATIPPNTVKAELSALYAGKPMSFAEGNDEHAGDDGPPKVGDVITAGTVDDPSLEDHYVLSADKSTLYVRYLTKSSGWRQIDAAGSMSAVDSADVVGGTIVAQGTSTEDERAEMYETFVQPFSPTKAHLVGETITKELLHDPKMAGAFVLSADALTLFFTPTTWSAQWFQVDSAGGSTPASLGSVFGGTVEGFATGGGFPDELAQAYAKFVEPGAKPAPDAMDVSASAMEVLPVGSVVTDAEGDVYVHFPAGWASLYASGSIPKAAAESISHTLYSGFAPYDQVKIGSGVVNGATGAAAYSALVAKNGSGTEKHGLSTVTDNILNFAATVAGAGSGSPAPSATPASSDAPAAPPPKPAGVLSAVSAEYVLGDPVPAPYASKRVTYRYAIREGERYVIATFQSDKQAKTTVLASMIYTLLGVHAAAAVMLDNGTVALYVPAGFKPATTQATLEKYKDRIAAEYPADAWIGNIGLFGNVPNEVWGIWTDGETHLRVSGQGSFLFRWGGTDKQYPAYEVEEIESLLDASKNAMGAAILAPAKDDPSITFSMLSKIGAVTDAQIQALVASAGGMTDLVSPLVGRRNFLSAKAQTLLSSEIPMPASFTPAKAKSTGKKDVRDIAVALVTDGKRVLLIRRADTGLDHPGEWTFPGGSIDPGEDAPTAALRELGEELGHVPDGIRPAGLTFEAELPNGRVAKTVVFTVSPSGADTFKPFVGSGVNTAHAWEMSGWAWVALDEIRTEIDGTTGAKIAIWIPKVHPGLVGPTPYGDSGVMTSILHLWKEHAAEWFAAAKGAVPTSGFLGQNFEKYAASGSGLPFLGVVKKNPGYRSNPSGYTLSGVVAAKDGSRYVEYRPRLASGSRPRIRVAIQSAPVETEMVAEELRDLLRRQKTGHKHGSRQFAKASSSFVASIYPPEALAGFTALLRTLTGKENPSWEDLETLALLDLAGLPMTKVTAEAEAVFAPAPDLVAAAEPVPVFQVGAPAEAVPTAPPMGVGVFTEYAVPKGGPKSLKLTKQQIETISGVRDALVKLLGSDPSPSSGAGATDPNKAKDLKGKIQHAILDVKSNANDREHAAKYLRWLAVARRVGLWPSVLDPGRRVLYRTIKIGGLGPSLLATSRSADQIKAMQAAGLFSGSDVPSAISAWIKAQRSGSVGFTMKNGEWETISGASLKPPSYVGESVPESWFMRGYEAAGTAAPTWAAEPWANVAGFAIDYNEHGFSGKAYHSKPYVKGEKAAGHWGARWGAYTSSGTIIRTTADSSSGFVLLPTQTLDHATHTGEYEVIWTAVDDPIPCEIIRWNTPGTDDMLTQSQVSAYHLARPAYPLGYAKTAYSDVVKANPAPRREHEAPATQFPRGTVVQSLIFDRDVFGVGEAREWADEHGYDGGVSADVAEATIRLRQEQPNRFREGSFRTIMLRSGVRAVVGLPRS